MAAFAADPPNAALRTQGLADLAAELAHEPEAARWARDCAWVPGTGHCRHRDCNQGCLFRAQREADMQRWRRLRRLLTARRWSR